MRYPSQRLSPVQRLTPAQVADCESCEAAVQGMAAQQGQADALAGRAFAWPAGRFGFSEYLRAYTTTARERAKADAAEEVQYELTPKGEAYLAACGLENIA